MARVISDSLRPLTAYRQWINYTVIKRSNGKTDKIPIDPRTGMACDAHSPAVQTDYDTAAASGLPVGFVFTDVDPYFFLDVDDCRDGPTGAWSATATDLVNRFSGCAVEISQSGQGLHIFGRLPEGAAPQGNRCSEIKSEMYRDKRFVALTDANTTGHVDTTPDPAVFNTFVQRYFPVAEGVSTNGWTTAPDPGWRGPEDDATLVKKMLASKSAKSIIGTSASLEALWKGDEGALGRVFPDTGGQGRAFDWSQADAALCSHLAFWTGKDCDRMLRLWGASALGQREKFQDREAYVTSTILGAVSMCGNVYQDPKTSEQTETQQVPGYKFADLQTQLELFAGCTYVLRAHRVFVPSGDLLRPEQFRACYGGWFFAMDGENDKTTRNAWECFTESRAWDFPKAAGTCFRPELKQGVIIEQDGDRLVNTYVPVQTACTPGDASPMLDLMRRMLPVERDREILLAYMAALVQNPGAKFQWCPVLQGAQGNGKSFLTTALSACVGEKYTHQPDAKDIGNVFNAWLQNKLLIVIEEVYARDKIDTINALKWMVTNRRVPSQAKGIDQTTIDNRANFFMCSNHKDAIAKTRSDRRFAVFYTAQQSPEDLAASGMGGEYFPRLYEWARGSGFAIINNYLRTYQVPTELNPAGACHRAPDTSSTNEALTASLGPVEQIVLEAIDEERPGFTGGWVSSMALNRLIDQYRIKIPMNKRPGVLADIGFIPHPTLRDGRVTSTIPFEQGKPRLYIKQGHVAINAATPAAVVKMYCEAQGYVMPEAPAQAVAQ